MGYFSQIVLNGREWVKKRPGFFAAYTRHLAVRNDWKKICNTSTTEKPETIFAFVNWIFIQIEFLLFAYGKVYVTLFVWDFTLLFVFHISVQHVHGNFSPNFNILNLYVFFFLSFQKFWITTKKKYLISSLIPISRTKMEEKNMLSDTNNVTENHLFNVKFLVKLTYCCNQR